MQARRNRAGGVERLQSAPPLLPQQVFAKIDPLPIDNDSEKKKVAKKKKLLQISRNLLVTLLLSTTVTIITSKNNLS